MKLALEQASVEGGTAGAEDWNRNGNPDGHPIMLQLGVRNDDTQGLPL
jgi:hypothetical protein